MTSPKISLYFTEEEATCRCGKCDYVPVSEKLLTILDDVRQHFGKPVNVNCMVRCEEHNREVGGRPMSRHLPKFADAADAWIGGVSPESIFSYVDSKFGEECGIHAYNTFIHIDTRGWAARW